MPVGSFSTHIFSLWEKFKLLLNVVLVLVYFFCRNMNNVVAEFSYSGLNFRIFYGEVHSFEEVEA